MIKILKASAAFLLLFFVSVLMLSACGGGGGGGGSSLPIATNSTPSPDPAPDPAPDPPTLTTPRFAYAANRLDDTLSIYVVDASTGKLRHNGYALTGTAPTSVAVDPSGRFVYVANNGTIVTQTGSGGSGVMQTGVIGPGGGSVSVYTISQTTGALTAGTPIAAGTGQITMPIMYPSILLTRSRARLPRGPRWRQEPIPPAWPWTHQGDSLT